MINDENDVGMRGGGANDGMLHSISPDSGYHNLPMLRSGEETAKQDERDNVYQRIVQHYQCVKDTEDSGMFTETGSNEDRSTVNSENGKSAGYVLKFFIQK